MENHARNAEKSGMRLRNELDDPAHATLRASLFAAGFLVTDRDVEGMDDFPFYGNWNKVYRDGFFFLTHRRTPLTFLSDGPDTYFLIGHAYNPFTMVWEEEGILTDIADADKKGSLRAAVDELTGFFVFGTLRGGRLYFENDPSGMQSAAVGYFGETFYLTSHPQLVGDLCGLSMSPLAQELTQYKWYDRVMGPYLPGDMTPFDELHRVVPNIGYTYAAGHLTHRRFYPCRAFPPCKTEQDYQGIIKKGADILARNMELVSRKWERPAISLTGGIDSNTTFAAANGHYDRFTAFSYLSAPKEAPDAEAARRIAGRFGVPYTLYRIPDRDPNFAEYPLFKAIIDHGNGYVSGCPENEYRKRAYLYSHLDCDVEVKSWVSETVRAYWYKHFGRKRMPPLSPRLFRNLYKIFLFDRRLAHKVDRVFADYIKTYEYRSVPACYDPSDLHYNEAMWGAWGGMNISEMKIYRDITSIYDNRTLLDLLLRVPLADRISDRHHLDIKALLNPDLAAMNIRVVNLKETTSRAWALNLIFTVNSHLPF